MNDLLNRAILLLASACALLVLASCDLSGPDEPLPFAWAEVGATFTYDFVPVVDSGYFDGGMVPVPSHTAEALTVRIILRDFGDVSAPIFNIFSMAGIPGHFSSIQLELSKFSRRSDGLYGIGLCPTSGQEIEYLRVPIESSVKEFVVPRTCKEGYINVFQVVAVDEAVTVPVGTFNAIVMQSRLFGLYREYWNEGIGLLRTDVYDDRDLLVGYLEMSRRDVASFGNNSVKEGRE